MRRFGSIAGGLAAATLAVFLSGCTDYGPYADGYYGSGPYNSYWPYAATSGYDWYDGPRYPVYRRGHDGHSAAWWAEHRRVQRAERAEHERVMRQRAQNRRAERRQEARAERRAERRRADRRSDYYGWRGQYDDFQSSREWQPGEPRYARGRQ